MMQAEDLDERTLQAVSILAAAMNRVGRTNGIVTEAVRTVLSARSSRALAFASRAFNSMEGSLRGRIGEEAQTVAQELRHDLPRFGPRPVPKPRPAPDLDPAMFLAKLRDPWADTAKSAAKPTVAPLPNTDRRAPEPSGILAPPPETEASQPQDVRTRISEQVADLRRLRSLLQKSV